MPRRFTMSDLVLRAKRRADKENDDHIASPEWKALISEQYGDLYSVVAAAGLRYFEKTTTITANGSASYTEPEDHFATVGVDFLVQGTTTGQRRALHEIMVQERAHWSGLVGEAQVYTLSDDQIFLYPRPTTGSYLLTYIPQAPNLGAYADGDAVDVVTPDGEAFLLWGTAVKALAKSQHDVTLAIAEREAARARLAEWAAMRAFHTPRRRIVEGDIDPNSFDPSDWRYR